MSIFGKSFGKKKEVPVKKAVAKPNVTKRAAVKKTVAKGGKSRGK